MGIQAQALLIGLDGFAEHLMALADHTHIVECHRLAQVIGLNLGRLLELSHRRRVFVLCQQRITEVVEGLRVAVVLLQSLAVADFGIGIVARHELLIALAHVLTVGLCRSRQGYQSKQQRDGRFATKQRHTLQQRVLAFQQADFDDEQQQRQDTERLELLVVVAVDGGLRLLLREFIELVVEQILGVAVVLDVDIGTAACRGNLLTHILVQGRHHRLSHIVGHVVTRTGNGYWRSLCGTDT